MPESSLSILPGLPAIYKERCFKAINQQPVSGLFGFISFKNDSKLVLEQRL
jgi:hypothetical protein